MRAVVLSRVLMVVEYPMGYHPVSSPKVAQDGDRIRCVSLAATGITPRDGDLVVVRRRREHLEETTVKRVIRSQGELVLMPESTDPRWQTPIPLRSHDSVEVTVVARALYAYRPL